MIKSRLRELKYINKGLLICSIIFAIGGAFLILDASSISSILYYGESSEYYFFIKQLFFIAVSFIISICIISVPSKIYKGISIFLIFIIVLLLLGQGVQSTLVNSGISEATLSIFGSDFQIAEFLKVLLIVYMGFFYGKWVNTEHKKYSFLIPLIICGISTAIIVLKGDFGTAVLMLTLFGLIFLKIPTKEKLFKILKVIMVVGMLSGILFLKFGYLIYPKSYIESSSRLKRLLYVDPCDRYEDASGYQVCNGYIAIHNGGLFGVGIGKSTQKYLYLPESHTDFIFPIVVEELGSLFGILILIGYIYIAYLIFKISSSTYHLYQSIICYGIGIYFLLHVFVNLGGVLGIIPLTGVPFPFLSYGGSYCISLFASIAIVQRINIESKLEKQNREIKDVVNNKTRH